MITHEYRQHHHIEKKPDFLLRVWQSLVTNNVWSLILVVVMLVTAYNKNETRITAVEGDIKTIKEYMECKEYGICKAHSISYGVVNGIATRSAELTNIKK